MMKDLMSGSYLSGGNAAYIDELYEAYLQGQEDIAPEWKSYFDRIQVLPGPRDVPHEPVRELIARIARERSSPRAVQEKLAFAFQHAQEHAAACGLRPAVEGPRPLQWLTTFRHFKSWAAINAGVYVAGHLRPNAAPAKKKSKLHPQIGS